MESHGPWVLVLGLPLPCWEHFGPQLLNTYKWSDGFQSSLQLSSPVGRRTPISCSNIKAVSWGPFTYFILLIFFFFFYSCTSSIRKFLGWGSNRSCSCQPPPQPQQHWIQDASVTHAAAYGNTEALTQWARPGIEPACSQRPHLVLNPLGHRETPIYLFSKPH